MFIEIAVLTSLFIFGGYLVLKRKAPRLSDQDLHGVPGVEELSSGNLQFHVVKELSLSERDKLKAAFLAGSDFRWIVIGGDGHHEDFDKEDSEVATKHRRVVWYMLECVVRVAELYGHVIVCRDGGEEGKYLGSVCLIPPYSSRSLFFLHFMRSIIPLGRPVPAALGPDVSARFDAFTNATEHEHRNVLGSTPHWYVLNLGVAPTAQGKGVGSKLIRIAIALSGSTDTPMPIYLECHDQNVPFYKKMGFERAKRYDMVPKIDKPWDNTPYAFNAMVYSQTP